MVLEDDETIGVAGSATGLTVNPTTLTLSDDDAAALTINDATSEEGELMTFTVTLDRAVSGGLTVTPSYTKWDGLFARLYTEHHNIKLYRHSKRNQNLYCGNC